MNGSLPVTPLPVAEALGPEALRPNLSDGLPLLAGGPARAL